MVDQRREGGSADKLVDADENRIAPANRLNGLLDPARWGRLKAAEEGDILARHGWSVLHVPLCEQQHNPHQWRSMTIPATFPEKVREELRSQILGACALAAEGFEGAKGREDAVTGAIGERLRLKEKLVAVDGEGTWKFSISWNKFRSAKGKSGEEREIGADGIIQFELLGSLCNRVGFLR